MVAVTASMCGRRVDPGRVVEGHLVGRSRRWWKRTVLTWSEPGRFAEALRRQMGGSGSPEQVEKRLVCSKGHTLMWLVRTQWGRVPVANRIGRGHCEFRPSGGMQSPPMTLEQWPAGEHLPFAACACHDQVEISVHEARSWLESPRDKYVYSP